MFSPKIGCFGYCPNDLLYPNLKKLLNHLTDPKLSKPKYFTCNY